MAHHQKKILFKSKKNDIMISILMLAYNFQFIINIFLSSICEKNHKLNLAENVTLSVLLKISPKNTI